MSMPSPAPPLLGILFEPRLHLSHLLQRRCESIELGCQQKSRNMLNKAKGINNMAADLPPTV